MLSGNLAALVAGAAIAVAIKWTADRVWPRILRARRLAQYRQRAAPAQADDDLQPAPPWRELFPSAAWSESRPTGPAFYIGALELTDLRCFQRATLRLRFPGEAGSHRYPNVNVLLGSNGSGKSTVLRAIAMTALGPVLHSSGFVPYYLVRSGQSEATLRAAFVHAVATGLVPLTTEVRLERIRDLEQIEARPREELWQEMYDESTMSFFVAGYGPNRRVASDSRLDPALESGRRTRRYLRVSSLFDDNAVLASFGSWLPQAPTAHQVEVSELLNDLLPFGASFTGKFEGPEPLFRTRGTTIPYRALSDGFRSYIGWLGDLLFQISAVAPAGVLLRDVGGIVLVDEVDLLLHPEWQRLVVPTISSLLPNVQFVFTTHSPIVAGTVDAVNIHVAREHDDGTSSLERLSEDVHGLNADQVLLSSYFNLATTRAPDAAAELAGLARDAMLGDLDDTLTYLRALSRGTEGPDERPN